MRGIEVLASVIAGFFVIGIAVGVLLVVARPARRRRRDARVIGWEEPPGPEDYDTPPRWPGGTSA